MRWHSPQARSTRAARRRHRRSGLGYPENVPEIVAPQEFLSALDSLKGHEFRRELHVSQIPPPKRIAPWSVALLAEINESIDLDPDFYRGESRFVFLYDPDGQSAWDGRMRIVTHAKAPVDTIMADDPLLGEAAWSWLVEALESNAAPYHNLTGTVTRVYNESFGGLDLNGMRTDIELRASWSPDDSDLSVHLRAWADLAASIAGLEPEGIASLSRRFHERGR